MILFEFKSNVTFDPYCLRGASRLYDVTLSGERVIRLVSQFCFVHGRRRRPARDAIVNKFPEKIGFILAIQHWSFTGLRSEHYTLVIWAQLGYDNAFV